MRQRLFPGQALVVPGYATPLGTLVDEDGDIVLLLGVNTTLTGPDLHVRPLWDSFHASVLLEHATVTQETCDEALQWLTRLFGYQLVLHAD